MHYLIRRKISLQLLSLYLLFVIPVLQGGAGLYVFQQNVLTQNAFQSDLGLAQAVALEVGANLRAAAEIANELSTAQAARDLDLKQLASVLANASNAHPDISLYFVCDPSGNMISTILSVQVPSAKISVCKIIFKELSQAIHLISHQAASVLLQILMSSPLLTVLRITKGG